MKRIKDFPRIKKKRRRSTQHILYSVIRRVDMQSTSFCFNHILNIVVKFFAEKLQSQTG